MGAPGRRTPLWRLDPGPLTLLCLSFCTRMGGDDKARSCLLGLRGPVRQEQVGPQDRPERGTAAPSPLRVAPKDGAGRVGGCRRSPHIRTGTCFLVFADSAGVAAFFFF